MRVTCLALAAGTFLIWFESRDGPSREMNMSRELTAKLRTPTCTVNRRGCEGAPTEGCEQTGEQEGVDRRCEQGAKVPISEGGSTCARSRVLTAVGAIKSPEGARKRAPKRTPKRTPVARPRSHLAMRARRAAGAPVRAPLCAGPWPC